MSVLALGTAHDWTGRTSDFVGLGTVLTVVALAVGAFVLSRARLSIGARVVVTLGVAMTALAVIELLAWPPSPWWVVVLATYAAVARWDLRRALRRGS